MIDPTPTRWAYCIACGRVANLDGPSLDPSRPIIVCRWVDSSGKAHGHGRGPGTWSQAEAETIVDTARRARATAQHPNHPGSRRWSAMCERCDYTTRHDLHRTDDRRVPGCPSCAGMTEHTLHLEDRRADPHCPDCRAVWDRLAARDHVRA